MAYATVTIPGDGSTTLITASFALGEINQEHVTVRVTGEVDGSGNPVYRTYTKLGSSQYQVDGPAAPDDQFYVVERRVPKEELLVDWEDNDAITEANLNTSQKQAIMIAHEALDKSNFSVRTSDNTEGPTITRGTVGRALLWDAAGNIIPGPNGEDIAGAQVYAAEAKAAAIQAAASEASAEAAAETAETLVGLSLTAIQPQDYLWPLRQLGPVSTTDWTDLINNVLLNESSVLLPEGYTYHRGLLVGNRSKIVGVNPQKSILSLLPGSNKHCISTPNFDALWNTASSVVAPQGIVLENFTIDGRSDVQTAGNGISLYARLFALRNLRIKKIKDDGIKCDYRDSAAGPITPDSSGELGMEAEFRYLALDYIGGHGLNMRGPHDSFLENVHVIHASQKLTNTYDSFRFEPTFTSRGINLHCYNSGSTGNQRYGIYDAAGCDIMNSHFEGSASANVYIKAQRAMYNNIRAYATRNAPYNVIVGGNQNRFSGHLGGKASGMDCIGIRLGLDGTDFSAENVIDIHTVDNLAGSVDFSLSQGGNKITVRGTQGSGPVIVSAPKISDELDILISGAALTRYTNNVNSITAAGTTQADATQLTALVNRVTTVPANSGVRLPPAAPSVGNPILVINASAVALKVWPNGTDAIEYGGFPAFVTVPAGKSALFDPAFNNLYVPLIST